MGPDWRQGYGFQFWRCTHNAFRGDGADGQFCVVIPDKDAVIAITAQTGRHAGRAERRLGQAASRVSRRSRCPADAAGQEKLKQTIANLEAHPAKKGK